MDIEQWRPIPGFEGLYEASDRGRIRSLDRDKRRGRLLKQRPQLGRQYIIVMMCKDGAYQNQLVHRLVLKAFRGEPPSGFEACHNNGDAADNRLDNLRWDTRAGNSRDQVTHGTHRNTVKTHCKRGHRFDTDNTYVRPGGQRNCRECKRLVHDVRYNARRKRQD